MDNRNTSQRKLVVIFVILAPVFLLGVYMLGIVHQQNSDTITISNCKIQSTGQGITVQLVTDQSSIQPNSITYEIINNSQLTLSYGEKFRLYYLDQEGAQSELTMLDDYGWQDILYYVGPGSSHINTDFLTGFKLTESGTYRLEHEIDINGQKGIIKISFDVIN